MLMNQSVMISVHDNINNIDATAKPYPEGPYVSFKEGKRRAEVKRLTIAKAEAEKKLLELNKQTTKTELSGVNVHMNANQVLLQLHNIEERDTLIWQCLVFCV